MDPLTIAIIKAKNNPIDYDGDNMTASQRIAQEQNIAAHDGAREGTGGGSSATKAAVMAKGKAATRKYVPSGHTYIHKGKTVVKRGYLSTHK